MVALAGLGQMILQALFVQCSSGAFPTSVITAGTTATVGKPWERCSGKASGRSQCLTEEI